MNDDRFKALMTDESTELTPAEIIEGWHFCWEFDGLLVAPSSEEFECCTCPLLYMQIDTVAVNNKIVWQEHMNRITPSNEELRKLAERNPPPREWFEDTELPW